MSFGDVISRALDHYGFKNQMIKTAEELAELSQALCKMILSSNSHSEFIAEQVRGEIADVTIMLEQMKMHFGRCEEEIDYKLRRLEKRIAEENLEEIESTKKHCGCNSGHSCGQTKAYNPTELRY